MLVLVVLLLALVLLLAFVAGAVWGSCYSLFVGAVCSLAAASSESFPTISSSGAGDDEA